jgi:hypothetical protein
MAELVLIMFVIIFVLLTLHREALQKLKRIDMTNDLTKKEELDMLNWAKSLKAEKEQPKLTKKVDEHSLRLLNRIINHLEPKVNGKV